MKPRLYLLLSSVLAGIWLTGCAAPGDTAAAAGSSHVAAERQVIVAIPNDHVRTQRRAGSISRPYAGAGNYRVAAPARQRMAGLARHYGMRPVASWPIGVLDLHCVVFELPHDRSRDELLATLALEPDVVIAQPMQQFSVLSGASGEASAATHAGVAAMNIAAAHAWATGKGVKVALIDTGVDAAHPELAGRVQVAADFVGRRSLRPEEEPHGLAVAGVIAARANEALGTIGVAPGARLLALRACWHIDPVNAVCNSLTLAQAIAAAIDHAAAVINLSLTGPPDPLLQRLLAAAMERHIIVVGAVPDGTSPAVAGAATTAFPTSVPGVIAVQSAELAPGSSRGSVRAPGQDITTLRPGGGHAVASGSSLAAAHVSGAVALMLERRPRLDGNRARALLEEHTYPVARGEGDAVEVVNACLAVAALVGGRCPRTAGQPEGLRQRVALPRAGDPTSRR
ncbi:MAG TPA: S8 family serine peptidase [Gammaproteobacteria bacterium]|nr:S8 family serine peptidase [Gammaproteobacteria bacterium]